MKRLTSGEFKAEHDVTVGVEFTGYDIKVEDKIIRLQIWDTAGQESFRSVTKIFYRNAHAVVLGFSVGDRGSFDHLNDWLNEIHASCTPDVLVLLAGCKSDIAESMRQVKKETAIKFQLENNLLYFSECSAKSGTNITNLFVDISKFLFVRKKEELEQDDRSGSVIPGGSERSNSVISNNKQAVTKKMAPTNNASSFGQ